jgi:hypothetical protein
MSNECKERELGTFLNLNIENRRRYRGACFGEEGEILCLCCFPIYVFQDRGQVFNSEKSS